MKKQGKYRKRRRFQPNNPACPCLLSLDFTTAQKLSYIRHRITRLKGDPMKKCLDYAATVLAAVAVSVFLSYSPAHSKPPAEVKEKRPAPASPAIAAKGRTVFDASHKEIFSPVKKGTLDYSAFRDMLKASGAAVSVNKDKISSKALEGVGTYIIAGPSEDIGPDEIGALHAFVNKGGNLLVMLHISAPVARLTETFGVVVSNFVVAEETGNIGAQPQDFYITRFTPHPVTEGLRKISVYGSWGLLVEGAAKEVAATSDNAWADLNRDRKRDEGEPASKFGVVAVASYGAGKVVVVADDAPFANKFLKEADNTKLAGNIIKWFKE